MLALDPINGYKSKNTEMFPKNPEYETNFVWNALKRSRIGKKTIQFYPIQSKRNKSIDHEDPNKYPPPPSTKTNHKNKNCNINFNLRLSTEKQDDQLV